MTSLLCLRRISSVRCFYNKFPHSALWKSTTVLQEMKSESSHHPITTVQKHYMSSNSSNDSLKQNDNVDEVETLYRAIDVLVKGHELSVLESYIKFMSLAAKHLDLNVAGVLKPKFIADRSTFLKSIHVHKKHRVQYEIRTHRRVLQLKYLTSSTAKVYLEYVQRNLPAGMAMHVHKWELERIPEHIRQEMAKNMAEMSASDWEKQAEFLTKMKDERLTHNSDYEEYHTTKRFLLGTVM